VPALRINRGALLALSKPFFLALGLFTLTACGSDAGQKSTLAIATGGPAGLYYPFGGGMASLWSKHISAVNVKAEVTGGSLINVIQVARGESEFGLAMADVVTDAYLGQGRFKQPLALRVLVNAYPNVVHILTLADSEISSVEDLKGRRVAIGAAGSGTAVAAENVLQGLGVPLSDLVPTNLSFGETTAALKDGTIDAGFVVGGLGIAAVTELAVTRDLVLVALTDDQTQQLQKAFPAYAPFIIPPLTYPGIAEPVLGLGIWSAVVVHAQMPEALAFELVCTLFKYSDALLKVSPVARAMTVENLLRLPQVPLHPGTRKYRELIELGADPDSLSCTYREASAHA